MREDDILEVAYHIYDILESDLYQCESMSDDGNDDELLIYHLKQSLCILCKHLPDSAYNVQYNGKTVNLKEADIDLVNLISKISFYTYEKETEILCYYLLLLSEIN